MPKISEPRLEEKVKNFGRVQWKMRGKGGERLGDLGILFDWSSSDRRVELTIRVVSGREPRSEIETSARF